MIDFNKDSFIKLKQVENTVYEDKIKPFLVEDEQIVFTFKGIRDGVVFTDKRIIAVNSQGLTGTKKDFTSLPYRKVQAFSVETAGVVDLDSELILWFSGLGMVRFEFLRNKSIHETCKIISEYVL